MHRFCLFIGLILLVLPLNAQDRAILYSNSGFHGLSINPAYAGSHEMLSVSLAHRTQWVGFEGAPAYSNLNIHSPLRNLKMGLGFLVLNERIGLRQYTGMYMNYAHRLTLGRGKLALGLKAGVSAGSFDLSGQETNDFAFTENTEKYLLPNFGFGVYYYSDVFYAGLSVPLILGYEKNGSGELAAYHDFQKYTYYLTAGIKIPLADDWKLNPSALVIYDKPSGVLADAGLRVAYKEMVTVGAAYRTKGAIIMLMDYRITYQLKVGMSYDYGLSGINQYNRSSVGVALEYNFGYRIKAADPTIF